MTTEHSPRGNGQGHVLGVPERLQSRQRTDAAFPPLAPLDPAAEQPTLKDIMAAHERSAALSRADNLALHAEIQALRDQFSAQPSPGQGLQAFGSVHDLPLRHSKSGFDAYTLKSLPVDIDTLQTVPTPLLQTAEHKFVHAINARRGYKFKPDFHSQQVQDGITVALDQEITPLLTLQAIGELSADVHQALDAAAEGETDPSDFFAAVKTAAYLASWSQKLVESRLGEIAATLQYDQDTARKWAVQSYGSQNTLMGDSAAAVAFQLVKAAEPKPAVTSAWSGKGAYRAQQGTSGGRGGGRTGGGGGRNTPPAEQMSGSGAKAPARAQ